MEFALAVVFILGAFLARTLVPQGRASSIVFGLLLFVGFGVLARRIFGH
jgi:hypothetical protein